MKSWTKPTSEAVDGAVALLSSASQIRYFFERLSNPLWLEPLRDRGFFESPPPPIMEADGSEITIPPWSPSEFLAKIAGDPEVVTAAGEILLSLATTTNPRVQADLVNAALQLPVEVGVDLAGHATSWLESQAFAPHHALADLVANLAERDQCRTAIRLARVLLDVTSPESGDADSTSPVSLPEWPLARVDDYEYGELLQRVGPPLLGACANEWLSSLFDLLDTAILLHRGDHATERPEDLSVIWRPAVDDHAQNRGNGVLDLLVAEVRDSVLAIASANEGELTRLAELLQERNWKIYWRIKLYMIAQSPTANSSLLTAALVSRTNFDDISLRHEYYHLCKSSFGLLPEADQATLVEWVMAPAELDRFLEEDVPQETANKRHRYWQLERLLPFAAALEGTTLEHLRILEREFGPPEHPDFPYFMGTGWVGPESPRSEEELEAMHIEELIEFLQKWKPNSDTFGPSLEGLGRVLGSRVAKSPADIAVLAPTLDILDPTLIRNVLDGLNQATKGDLPFEWPPVLDLCNRIVSRPRDLDLEPRRPRQSDQDWGPTRREIASLIGHALTKETCAIGFDQRQAVWDVLSALSVDPEPSPEFESQYGGKNMNPATLSLNTVRGQAMHGVIKYVLWVHRQIFGAAAATDAGLDSCPEARVVLELHLDPAADPSQAVRAVYGQWIPWLIAVDSSWVAASSAAIFPWDESTSHLAAASWDTYIQYCGPYNNVLRVLEPQYRLAVERAGQTQPRGARPLASQNHLGDHLMTFFARGELDLESEGALVARFFEIATDSVLGHTIGSVGRNLLRAETPLPGDVRNRFQQLWDSRIDLLEASPEKHASELGAFGWWAACREFNVDWTLNHLVRVAKTKVKIEGLSFVLDWLSVLVETHPLDCTRCLGEVLAFQPNHWTILGNGKKIRSILEGALEADGEAASEEIDRVVNALGVRGHLEYQDLHSRFSSLRE